MTDTSQRALGQQSPTHTTQKPTEGGGRHSAPHPPTRIKNSRVDISHSPGSVADATIRDGLRGSPTWRNSGQSWQECSHINP